METGKRFGELLGGEVGEGVVDSFRWKGEEGPRNAPVGWHVDHSRRLAVGRGGQAALEVQTHLEGRRAGEERTWSHGIPLPFERKMNCEISWRWLGVKRRSRRRHSYTVNGLDKFKNTRKIEL